MIKEETAVIKNISIAQTASNSSKAFDKNPAAVAGFLLLSDRRFLDRNNSGLLSPSFYPPGEQNRISHFYR